MEVPHMMEGLWLLLSGGEGQEQVTEAAKVIPVTPETLCSLIAGMEKDGGHGLNMFPHRVQEFVPFCWPTHSPHFSAV